MSAALVTQHRGALTPSERRGVLWLGSSVPDLLVAACTQRRLRVRSITESELHELAPQARALVIEVPAEDPAFHVWCARCITAALNHGLGVALVQFEPDGEGTPLLEDQEGLLRFFATIRELRGRDPNRVPVMYRDYHRLADWVQAHDPRSGENPSLSMTGDEPMDEEARLLLRRAFHDFSGVRIDAFTGGRSGASVMLVQPDRNDAHKRALPFVVKIHSRGRMDRERSNASLIRDHVDGRLHAPMNNDRYVEGAESTLVVYDHVNRVIPYRMALESNATALIASLFEHTLGSLYASAVVARCRLATEFGPERLKVIRPSACLRQSAMAARAVRPEALDEIELIEALEKLPPVECHMGTVHGDLHVGNLFSAGTDVLLIDYGSVLTTAPIVADAACLEVSVTFPSAVSGGDFASSTPPEAWLRRTYTFPCTAAQVDPLPGRAAWISSATRETRFRAALLDGQRTAYAVAIACNLLRYAAYDDNGTPERRAIAYELAADIIDAVARGA